MSGLHFHPLRVGDVQHDTDDAVVVSFELPAELQERFRFTPGQYLTLRRGGGATDAPRRSYSICAAAGETLRVGVRRVPGGAFSSWLHGTLKPGAMLDVMEPQGRFGAVLAAGAPRHMLAIAGGSGITPILAIVKTVLAREAGSRCTLLYGNRSLASTMFKEELEDLKNRHLTRLALHPVFSREPGDSPLYAGRLDHERVALFLRTLVDPRSVDQAFICGPHAMNDEAEAALLEAGIAAAQIHVERFGIPPEQSPADPHPVQPGDADAARVVLIRDGVTREFGFRKTDASLLDAATRAGLDVPYSCKSGVCATCRARLIEGRVRMDRNFALEKPELDAGFVLTCQSHPLTERVVVSFDER